MGHYLGKFMGKKILFTYERSSTPTGFVWNTNMAAALLFWNTNMAAVTSRENALLSCRSCHWRAIGWPFSHSPTTMLCWDTFMGGPGVCHSVYKMVDSGSEIFATFEELKKSLFTSHYLTHYCYSWMSFAFARLSEKYRCRVFIWCFKSLRSLLFQFLLWFEAFTEALNLFASFP